jgi:hypothetical protein
MEKNKEPLKNSKGKTDYEECEFLSATVFKKRLELNEYCARQFFSFNHFLMLYNLVFSKS